MSQLYSSFSSVAIINKCVADMAPVCNGITNELSKVEKNDVARYAPASTTGYEGPDQILSSEVDRTWETNGRVRIKFNDDDNKFEPISIPGLLNRTANKHPNHPALVSRPDSDGKRTTITYKEYENQVRTVAKAFLQLGLERHHSVCIIGFNSSQWFIADLAAIYAGGFAAGIYTTNSPEACQYCAESSKANIIVVEDDKQLRKILQIKESLPELKAIVQYDGIPDAKDALSWDELLEIGSQQSDDKLDDILKTIGINECCTLVYTSGTVGNPKAVMLSHDNLIAETQAIVARIGMTVEAKEIMVSFLPLSHVAAQIVDMFLPLLMVGTVYMADKNALKGSLVETLVEARPTFFLGVPRVWEKIHEKIQSAAQNNGHAKNWIFNWAKNRGLEYHANRVNPRTDRKSWGYLIAKWLVFDKLKSSLGLDRCRVCATAAAPLSTDIKRYLMSLDVIVIEAYGMSECAGGHAVMTNDKFRLGSVGYTLPAFATKLDNTDAAGEGEICMSGRHVFMGYLNDPDNTNEAKDEDNWLHSGDLGKLDADGFLYVTGRIKELVITAGGENVSPIHIEQLLKNECPAISNAMLVGDRRKYLTILITLKTEVNLQTGEPSDALAREAIKWTTSLGSRSTTVTQLIKTRDPLIEKGISDAISRVNKKAISNAQRLQKYRILPHDFSLPTGELGPTLKLKRNVVANKYANLIEDMYAN